MEKEKSDIKKSLRNYRHRIEKRMAEHMDMDENARNTSSFKDMHECWDKARKMEKDLEHCKLTTANLAEWVESMKNADGTTGAHWTKEQTTAAAKVSGVPMGHITPEDFWAAMNMIYSDYSPVAEKFGVNKPEFYAEMAKSFLFDKDGPDPADKLAAYYRGVVEYED